MTHARIRDGIVVELITVPAGLTKMIGVADKLSIRFLALSAALAWIAWQSSLSATEKLNQGVANGVALDNALDNSLFGRLYYGTANTVRGWFGVEPIKPGATARAGQTKADSSMAVNGQKLAQVKTKSGKTAMVAAPYQRQLQGFLDDLEATGYVIDDLGGFANRRNVNNPSKISMHALGLAIDINPAKNRNGSSVTDLPSEAQGLAEKWGLGWGLNWKNVKDPMHFSAAPREGGRYLGPAPAAAAAANVADPKAPWATPFLTGDYGPLLPSAATSPAAGAVKMDQSSTINIYGAGDAKATAEAVEKTKKRLDAQMIMNLRSVVH